MGSGRNNLLWRSDVECAAKIMRPPQSCSAIDGAYENECADDVCAGRRGKRFSTLLAWGRCNVVTASALTLRAKVVTIYAS